MQLNALDYLRFKDWISSKTNLNDDWITVARFDEPRPDSFGIFSVVALNNPSLVKEILSNWSWDVSSDFGKPFFSMHYPEKEIRFNLGDKEKKNNISFEPFTVLREFYSAAPARVDITQSFLFYHGLCYDASKDHYVEPIKEEEAIRYRNPCFVDIKTTYIRDYLAARNMVLVRYHDHRRFVGKSSIGIIGSEKDEFEVTEEDRRFLVVIGQGLDRKAETFSRLLGKDVVYPYKEPMHEDYVLLAGKEKKKFVDFIVGIDSQGKEVEETCNEHEISPGKFLTPTFFKREVLQKYYQNTRRYTVTAGYLHCLSLWGLPYGINEEGYVHVWLGDLGRIPYEEQLHFRQYNIVASGKLGSEFVKTQIFAQFVETKDLVHNLKKLYNEINTLFEKKIGFKIFEDLSDKDSYIYKAIHIPTTAEIRELDEQLIFLAKLLPDSINKSKLESIVKWKPPTSEENNKIRFLEKFFEEIFSLGSANAEQMSQPFRNLQKLRSQSAAHRKSNEFEKTLTKIGLNRKNPGEICEFLIASLIVEMNRFKEFLEKL